MLLSKAYLSVVQNAAFINSSFLRNLHTSKILQKKNKSSKEKGCELPSVAVILCGVGGLDGTEAAEAISLAIHCSENDWVPRFYAPDIELNGLTNHLTKKPDTSGPPRNALIEAARLGRPMIQNLCECKSCSAEALIIPGGYGAARTLSDFASKGAGCVVLPELQKIIEEFNCDKKPIGTLCLASTLVAKVLSGVKVTLGKESPKEEWPYAEVIKQVKEMGAKVEPNDITGVTYCKHYNVFSNPAWLYVPATYAEIHGGIGKMISMMKKSIVRC